MSYDSEDGKDAWKRYRRIIESTDTPMQDMLHEFGSEQFCYGYAAGVQAAREAVAAMPGIEWVHAPSALAAIDGLRGES